MHRSAKRVGWPDMMLQFVSRVDPQLGSALELMLMAAAVLFAPRPGPVRLLEKWFQSPSSEVRAPSVRLPLSNSAALQPCVG